MILMLLLSACDSQASSASKTKQLEELVVFESQNSVSTSQESVSYQSILDEYTEKLKNATPKIIDEYHLEAANNKDGLSGLALLSSEKVLILAEILNEGVMKMSEYMFEYGSGKYSEYEEWAGKLTDVYMTEAGKITNAYLESAQ